MLGSDSSACPSGFFPLDYEKACRRAAEQVVPMKLYGGSLSGNDLKAAYMSGCYWHTIDGRVYFNDKASSAPDSVDSAPDSVDSFALQLCAGAPIPARRYAAECGRVRQSPVPGEAWHALHTSECMVARMPTHLRACASYSACE